MPAAATIDQRWIPPADEARTLDGRMAASRSRQELPTRLTTLMSGAVPLARKSLQAELFVLGFNLQSLFFNFLVTVTDLVVCYNSFQLQLRIWVLSSASVRS